MAIRNPFTGEVIRTLHRRELSPDERRARSLGKRDRARLRRQVVAWDGEGYEAPEGAPQPYVLLANSEGAEWYDARGLSTEACLQAMLRSADLHRGAMNVIYGVTYDANQWLRDVPRDRLETLYKSGACWWRGYRIEYRPRRMFAVREPATGRRFTVWDVQPWFRSGLEDAIASWLGADHPDLDLVASMKRRRRAFRPRDRELIGDYTRAELRATVAITRSLVERLTSAGIRPGRYDGAGAAASSLLRAYGVKAHKGEAPREVEVAALIAYAGGRIEPLAFGAHEGAAWQYDLHAAYPWAMTQLPSLAGARWRKWSQGGPLTDHALYQVQWIPPRAMQPGHSRAYPLPWRDTSGGMFFPSAGLGWVWGPELRAALDCPAHDAEIAVLRGWVLEPASEARPFSWLRDLYEERLRMQREGDDAAEVVKLAMNALYGKLIQSIAWRDDKPPPYYQIEWAGLVTSYVRAAMWRAYALDPEAVACFETDAIYTTRPLPLDLGDGMGQWSAQQHEALIVVQSGVHLTRDGGQWSAATRGYNARELGDGAAETLRAMVLDGWRSEGESIAIPQSRFASLSSAVDLHWPESPAWRSWTREARPLMLWPQGKRAAGFGDPLAGLVPSWPVPIPETLSSKPKRSHPYSRTWRPSAQLLIEGVSPAIYEEEIEEATL